MVRIAAAAAAYSVAKMTHGGSLGNGAPPGRTVKSPHIPRNPASRALLRAVGGGREWLSGKAGPRARNRQFYASNEARRYRGMRTRTRSEFEKANPRSSGGNAGAMSGSYDSREGSWVKESDGKFNGSA